MFRAPLCPSSVAQEYYTVVAACDISCCGFQVAGLVRNWGLCVRFAGCLQASILHVSNLEINVATNILKFEASGMHLTALCKIAGNFPNILRHHTNSFANSFLINKRAKLRNWFPFLTVMSEILFKNCPQMFQSWQYPMISLTFSSEIISSSEDHLWLHFASAEFP